MIGIMSADEIDATLRRHRVGRIGCSVNDRPYVVPMNYAYDGTYVYSCALPGRKIDVMREQPLVCFEVDEIESASIWRCVIAEGIFEELSGEESRRHALAQLAARDAGLVPPSPILGERVVVFRLRLTERSGRFERRDA
jgi:nitroimidazol reductase NimA-like FMN-containing flavoprotein (pyridoxamine 5'-phosphate oxidase superfamily)